MPLIVKRTMSKNGRDKTKYITENSCCKPFENACFEEAGHFMDLSTWASCPWCGEKVTFKQEMRFV